MNTNISLGKCVYLVKNNVDPTTIEDAPYIGLEHIGQGTLHLNGYGSSKDITSIKHEFKKGDILFGKLRPYFRKVVQAPFDGVCSTDIWVIRSNPGFHQRYIFYSMADQKFIDFSSAGSDGTKMPRAKWDHVSQFERPYLDYSTQERIADILGTLDDKIELNQQMNKTLENMAHAIFKSWFVNFDPVYAKMERRDYPLPAEIMELFPDELVESELGLIPKGWKIQPLDKVANYLNGLAMQKYPAEENQDYIPVIKIRELRDGFTSQNSDRANINFPYDYLINNGDVLFSWSGSLLLKIWCGGIGGLNQHLFKVTSTEFPKWFYYLWTSHYLNEFIKIAADKATTMGHIKRSDLHKSLVCIPDASILDVGNNYIGCIFERTINNSLQISTLMQTRDSLLPYLVSGKIEIL